MPVGTGLSFRASHVFFNQPRSLKSNCGFGGEICAGGAAGGREFPGGAVRAEPEVVPFGGLELRVSENGVLVEAGDPPVPFEIRGGQPLAQEARDLVAELTTKFPLYS